MKVINVVDAKTNELIASISEKDAIVHKDYKIIETEEDDE